MPMTTVELRAYVIGAGETLTPETVEQGKKEIERMIDGADFCILPVWGDDGPRVGFQFDTGVQFWGVVEIVRVESPRIVICRAVLEN